MRMSTRHQGEECRGSQSVLPTGFGLAADDHSGAVERLEGRRGARSGEFLAEIHTWIGVHSTASTLSRSGPAGKAVQVPPRCSYTAHACRPRRRPSPYHGATIDNAPSWVRTGFSSSVSE